MQDLRLDSIDLPIEPAITARFSAEDDARTGKLPGRLSLAVPCRHLPPSPRKQTVQAWAADRGASFCMRGSRATETWPDVAAPAEAEGRLGRSTSEPMQW